jgi:hypothetical protein
MPTGCTRNINVPFGYLKFFNPSRQRLEFFEIVAMHHSGDGNGHLLVSCHFYPTNGPIKGPHTPYTFMPFLQTVQTELNFVKVAPSRMISLCDQCPVGKKNLTDPKVRQGITQGWKIRIEERFTPGEKDPESLHLLKLLQHR